MSARHTVNFVAWAEDAMVDQVFVPTGPRSLWKRHPRSEVGGPLGA